MSSVDYRALFELAADGMVVTNAAHRIIAVNETFANMVGEPRDSLIGCDPSRFITSTDLQLLPAQREPLARDGVVFSLRRLQHADGSQTPVEILAKTLPDGTTLGIVRDVRRRRPLTDALRSAESRLRAIAESLNVALVVTDESSRALYVNEHFSKLTGYSFDELMGHDLSQLIAADHDRQRMAARMAARLAGASEKYEMELGRKDGTTFTAEISASPMFDDDGCVEGTISVMADITERRRHDRELAERERRYRSLFEVTPLPTWVFDIETLRFCAVNPAAIEHYGYSEGEFFHMTLLDIRTEEDAQALTEFMATEKGRPMPRRAQHRKRDGTLIQVELVAEDFLLEGRRARIVVAKDITEQLRLQERQRSTESQLLLAQKMEAVGGLAGGVAHDFNNLLSVMLGASESIERDLPRESPLLEDVRDIRDAAERGAALTRQLLSLGRKEVRAPQLLDLNQIITNVARLLLRALGPKVSMQVRRGDGPLSIEADAGQLEQVIVNLAINARDAMTAGGSLVISTGLRELAEVEATLAGVLPGSYVTLEVKDDGIGMDALTRARAFEPFYTTKGPHHGTGLGLSTVYGIMQQSGGGITLESAVGQGTCATLYLPRALRDAQQAAIITVTGEHRVTGRRGRVLLVEDEPRVRAQARRLLERSGFAVTDAPDGAEGLFQFRAREGAVDVVVSDVMMPTMGGVEMVSKLREITPAVPVVFVSGYTADDRDLPLDERTLFVPKPYSIVDLCDAIDSLLAI